MKNTTIAMAVSASLSLGLLASAVNAAEVRDIVNLKTVEAGVYEISYNALSEFGADVSGERLSDIAMMNQGNAVHIQLTGSTADPLLFGEGSVLRFIAEQVDSLYSDTNVYTLRSDASKALRMGVDNALIPRGASETSYLASSRLAPQTKYSFTSPNAEDPWYNTRIVALNGAQSERMSMQLSDVAPGGNTGASKAKLSVSVWGTTDLPGVADDHSVRLAFNGQEVASSTFDGLAADTLSSDLEAVVDGNNVVTVTLPMDTGYSFDAVNLNSVEVQYPRKFIAQDDRLDFTSSGRKFRLSGFSAESIASDDDLVIIREDANGVNLVNGYARSCRVSCNVTFAGSGQAANYYVAAQATLPEPEIEALPLEQDITSGQAHYLIISHPDFIGDDGNNLLEGLAAELTSEMGSAKVVNVETIYAQFGHHLFDPSSIQDYIRHAVSNMGTAYVMLVGGDVYDYRNFENDDATSFIPSIYTGTGNSITFAPVDAKYVDLDDDNVPDLPIARLPVRTTSQLAALFNKRTAYLNRDYGGTALLVADQFDEIQQYDFSSDANQIESQYLQGFSVEKAYVDELGVNASRRMLIDSINDGVSLTAFFGHSSTNQWSFNGLLTGRDAARLNNLGRPTVVTQWGCWNAYYVSPNEDSMGHRFMMEGEQGAVSVMGATTLTNANSERELAQLVFARLSQGERLGDAVTNAKQEYAQDNPDDLDVLLGWTVLGFPELLLN